MHHELKKYLNCHTQPSHFHRPRPRLRFRQHRLSIVGSVSTACPQWGLNPSCTRRVMAVKSGENGCSVIRRNARWLLHVQGFTDDSVNVGLTFGGHKKRVLENIAQKHFNFREFGAPRLRPRLTVHMCRGLLFALSLQSACNISPGPAGCVCGAGAA